MRPLKCQGISVSTNKGFHMFLQNTPPQYWIIPWLIFPSLFPALPCSSPWPTIFNICHWPFLVIISVGLDVNPSFFALHCLLFNFVCYLALVFLGKDRPSHSRNFYWFILDLANQDKIIDPGFKKSWIWLAHFNCHPLVFIISVILFSSFSLSFPRPCQHPCPRSAAPTRSCTPLNI